MFPLQGRAAGSVGSGQCHTRLDTRFLRLFLPTRYHPPLQPLRVPDRDTPPRGAVLPALCVCASPPAATPVSTAAVDSSSLCPCHWHSIRFAAVSAQRRSWTPRSRPSCSRSCSTRSLRSARSRSTWARSVNWTDCSDVYTGWCNNSATLLDCSCSLVEATPACPVKQDSSQRLCSSCLSSAGRAAASQNW
jgi:hypothetical protein